MRWFLYLTDTMLAFHMTILDIKIIVFEGFKMAPRSFPHIAWNGFVHSGRRYIVILMWLDKELDKIYLVKCFLILILFILFCTK